MKKLLYFAAPIAVIAAGVIGIAVIRSTARRPAAQQRLADEFKSLLEETTTPEGRIKRFCGACHLHPEPSVLPRGEWTAAIDLMYKISEDGPPWPRDTPVPDRQEVLDYYLQRAPESFEIPESESVPLSEHSLAFETLSLSPPDAGAPAIAGIAAASLQDDSPALAVCDLRGGGVWLFPYSSEAPTEPLVRLSHPRKARAFDVDQDGLNDLLVAETGAFDPSDDLNGSVVWLRQASPGVYQPSVLLDRVGRVADVLAADFENSGRIDLVAAIAGWRQTGNLAFLENVSLDRSAPEFEPRVVENKVGALAVETADLNGDGLLDFVALFGRQHEMVVGYFNDGKGGFDSKVLWQAPHPAWGFTNMNVVDLDGDGDLDIVVVNGKSVVGPETLRPYHGISWLENLSGEFAYHPIAAMPGAHALDCGDVDGDGRIDIVVGALISGSVEGVESTVVFRQAASGTFERIVCDRGKPIHAALLLTDVDRDGKPDIVLGAFADETSDAPPWLQILRRQ